MSTPLKDGVTCAIMAFNEQDTLALAVAEVRQSLLTSGRYFEILIVDDGSSDDTGKIADTLATDLSRPGQMVRAIHHPRNRGPASAILTGIIEATQPLFCFHPADNQVDFADLARALELLDEDYDLLVGQRSDRHDYSIARRITSYGYLGLAWSLFGLQGFRDLNFVYAWRNSLVRSMLPFDSRGVFLCTEILVRARDGGARVGMFPAAYRPRTAGLSTVGRPAVVLDTWRQMMRFWLLRLKRKITAKIKY